MSDEVETGDDSELGSRATSGSHRKRTPGTRERRRLTARTRLISIVTVVVGIAAILIAVNRYQNRGYSTPTNVGYVPGESSVASTLAAPSTSLAPSAPESSASKKSSSSRSKSHSAAPSEANTESAVPTNANGRPVMPRPIGQLRLDSLGVIAPVVSVSEVDGAIDVPADPKYVGIWDHGARPGGSRGSVIVVGHVDSHIWGEGSFFNLATVSLGTTVSIQYQGKTTKWRIVGRRVYQKSTGLPASVFSMNTDPRLVLITCGGTFDRADRSYVDNIVVYGQPA
jgi:hypothetical protein